MDTPYKWTKQVPSFFDGTRNGMAVAWPKVIKDTGGIRNQFHHVIDIVPTILELPGIPAPEMVNGIAQKPIEGMSMAYTFDKANGGEPSKRTTQYFEMLGNRALYHDGWIASTVPYRAPWDASAPTPKDIVNDVTWELYDLTKDWTQNDDVAAANPAKLKELQDCSGSRPTNIKCSRWMPRPLNALLRRDRASSQGAMFSPTQGRLSVSHRERPRASSIGPSRAIPGWLDAERCSGATGLGAAGRGHRGSGQCLQVGTL